MLDDLPNLEDLENADDAQFNSAVRLQTRHSKYPGAEIFPPGEGERYQKYIRGGHSSPMESGMGPEQMAESKSEVVHPHNDFIKYKAPLNYPNCIEIAEHINNCPICSKIYNNDKSVYMIAIVVLSIICILLLKKVMDL